MALSGIIVGALLGFVMQRGRFCVTGAFRDVWVSKSSWWIGAFFLAITVQAIGITALAHLGYLDLQGAGSAFAPFATIAGGFIFGFGILMAGGCATGTYYRAAEGLVGSWFALIFYALTAAVFKYGPFATATKEVRTWGATDQVLISDTLGISSWVLVALLMLGTGWLAYKNLTKPKLPVAQLPAEKKGINHLLFEKAWNPYITAVLIGLIAILAWATSVPSGRNGGLGITTPSAKLVSFLTTGELTLVDWSVYLVLGILIGSFTAAYASGEFKVRVPDAKTINKSIIGGVLMGWGACWAGGCSIGNGLVETAMFSWQGWVSLVAMIAGTGVAAYFFILPKRPSKARLT